VRWLVSLAINPYVVLVAAVIATGIGWRVARTIAYEDGRHVFDNLADRVATAITNRMTTYQQVLVGGAALFAASEHVDRGEWGAYVGAQRISERFPGIQALGFAQRVRPAERAAHVARVRREDGLAAYEIRPPGERSEYVVILYNEPYVGRNRNVVGFDMFAEPIRRAAMERARDGGQPAISGKVVLAGENPQDRPPGFIFYAPIFAKGQGVGTIEERRRALEGFIFGPFRMHDLMRGVLGPQELGVHFKAFDGENAEPDALLYDSVQHADPRPVPWQPLFYGERSIQVAGRTWLLQF